MLDAQLMFYVTVKVHIIKSLSTVPSPHISLPLGKFQVRYLGMLQGRLFNSVVLLFTVNRKV